MTFTGAYRGHVDSNERLRRLKAEKVRRILATRHLLKDAAVLDLGAGSGLLAQYLQSSCSSITAADRDTRPFSANGVPIHLVEGDRLPFRDKEFDVVIYNHVIEHVGNRTAQRRALSEIRRILAPSGHLYVAAPNRWALMEPHYRIPLLSWLPRNLADLLVQRCRGGIWYDCNPLSRGELRCLMRDAGFEVEDVSLEAIEHVLDLELGPGVKRDLMAQLPKWIFRLAGPMLPSFVMIGCKSKHDRIVARPADST